MFQGPIGYMAQICECTPQYTCSMETVQQNGRFTLFLVNSTLIYILFSLATQYIHFPLVGIELNYLNLR